MYVSLAEHARESALQVLSMKAMFTLSTQMYASSVAHVPMLVLQELFSRESKTQHTLKR